MEINGCDAFYGRNIYSFVFSSINLVKNKHSIATTPVFLNTNKTIFVLAAKLNTLWQWVRSTQKAKPADLYSVQ